jgi:RNA polymerase sigma-70 factor (ECF subfamily)
MAMSDDKKNLSVSDLAALGKLFEDHSPRLLSMVRRRIDPALAARLDPEELLNEAYVRATGKWRAFQRQSSMTPYAWLYQLVLQCLIDAWRRETRGKRDLRRDMPWPERTSIQLGLGLLSPATSPSGRLLREETAQRIRLIMECLSERDQEILWMRHYDELSFREVGTVLEISENAATVRYARALRRLKDLWLRDQKEPNE